MHARYAATYILSFARSAARPSICGSLSLDSVAPVGSFGESGTPAFGFASDGSFAASFGRSVRGDALTPFGAASSPAFMLHAAKSAAVGTSARAGHAAKNSSAIATIHALLAGLIAASTRPREDAASSVPLSYPQIHSNPRRLFSGVR